MADRNRLIDEMGAGGAQIHLDAFKNKFDTALLDEEREATHAKLVPENPGYPDVYVNGEDHTVTVDPYKNSHWIRDDSHGWRSAATVHRGALKDHVGVMRAVRQLDRHDGPTETFIPTSRMIDGQNKYTGKCTGTSSRGVGQFERPGQLPPITQLIYDNALPDKTDWRVTWEQYGPARTRFFDDRGLTDVQM